jgi:hypothetical protein
MLIPQIDQAVSDGVRLHDEDLDSMVNAVKAAEDVGITRVSLLRYQVLRLVDEIRQSRSRATPGVVTMEHRKLAAAMVRESDRAPVPMYLTCPKCNARHIDEGEFATKPHHTHSCQCCGLTWRPAMRHTVGVKFLPGFKNEPVASATPEIPAERYPLPIVVGSSILTNVTKTPGKIIAIEQATVYLVSTYNGFNIRYHAGEFKVMSEDEAFREAGFEESEGIE